MPCLLDTGSRLASRTSCANSDHSAELSRANGSSFLYGRPRLGIIENSLGLVKIFGMTSFRTGGKIDHPQASVPVVLRQDLALLPALLYCISLSECEMGLLIFSRA